MTTPTCTKSCMNGLVRKGRGRSSFVALSKQSRLVLACLALSTTAQVHAAETQATGKIVQTQGHISPYCRTVHLKRSSDSAIITFRIPDTGGDNSIMAVTLTAIASGLPVTVDYDPDITTGCGTEPKITWIGILNPG